jgi:hypothetical protein
VDPYTLSLRSYVRHHGDLDVLRVVNKRSVKIEHCGVLRVIYIVNKILKKSKIETENGIIHSQK